MGVENTSGLGLGTGLALGAFGSIASSIISGISNHFANRRNLDFAREQFEYNKYLNANQFQIHSADAQAAGINPIAMQGGSMQTGSVSAGQQGFDPSSSISPLMSLVSTAMTNKANANISDASNENAIKLADIEQKGLNERQEKALDNQYRIALLNSVDTNRGLDIQDEYNKIIDLKNKNDYLNEQANIDVSRSRIILDRYIAEINDLNERKRLEQVQKDYDLNMKKFEQAKKEGNAKVAQGYWDKVLDTLSLGWNIAKTFINPFSK